MLWRDRRLRAGQPSLEEVSIYIYWGYERCALETYSTLELSRFEDFEPAGWPPALRRTNGLLEYPCNICLRIVTAECQVVEKRSKLLQPLDTYVSQSWARITMDFIVGLPRCNHVYLSCFLDRGSSLNNDRSSRF